MDERLGFIARLLEGEKMAPASTPRTNTLHGESAPKPGQITMPIHIVAAELGSLLAAATRVVRDNSRKTPAESR
jgi:hypothetical protein